MRDYQDEVRKKDSSSKKVLDASQIKEKKGDEGRSLDSGIKSVMRSALGKSVDEVHVHTNPQAHDMASGLGAKAFTKGKDVYFAEGEYSPSTGQGRKLLAHELVHVAQQSEERQQSHASSIRAVEKEADAAAQLLTGGEKVSLRESAPSCNILMKEEEKKTAPTVARYKEEITPIPASGTISGPGFSFSYLYNIVKGAAFVTLNLGIPNGVSVSVTPLTDLGSGDYRVQGAEGTEHRAVIVSVSANIKTIPKVQVTLNRGGSIFMVVFQFPGAAGKG